MINEWDDLTDFDTEIDFDDGVFIHDHTKLYEAKLYAEQYYDLIPSLSSVDLMYLLERENLDHTPSLRTIVYWLIEFNKALPKELRGSRNRVKADKIRRKNY